MFGTPAAVGPLYRCLFVGLLAGRLYWTMLFDSVAINVIFTRGLITSIAYFAKAWAEGSCKESKEYLAVGS